MYKSIVVFFVISIIATYTFAENNPKFGSQSSSKNVEWGFDMVETFDNIADWPVSDGNASKILINANSNPDCIPHLPKTINGNSTPINHYSWWVSSPPTVDWIMDHRKAGGKIWDPLNTGKGKSVCMDLSHRQNNGLGDGLNHGPNHFGWYFGGDLGRSAGYDEEFYVFFMYFIPKNMYPTYENSATNVGEYEDGKYYLYNGSFKFATPGIGFKNVNTHSDEDTYTMSKGSTYGWVSRVFHISIPTSNKYFPRTVLEGHGYYKNATPVPSFASEQNTATKDTYGARGEYVTINEWRGIEFRYKKNTNNNEDGVFQVWDYDPKTGNATVLMDLSNIWFTCGSLQADKFNNFFIGGNNSNRWLWGDSMDPKYYVDDVIINGSRIGPKYFKDVLGIGDCGTVTKMGGVSVQ